jgi:hypothetical protein
VEIVVAMAIISVGVVTVLQVFSSGLRLAGRTARATEEAARGREIMDEALTRRSIAGKTEGSDGARNRWTIEARPVETEKELGLSRSWRLEEITVELRAGMGARERPFTLRTYRLARETDGPGSIQ